MPRFAPDHGNVGDSAIGAGDIAWLKKNVGAPPDLISDHGDPITGFNRALVGQTVLLTG